MHPLDCPPWPYELHADKDRILPGRAAGIVEGIRRGFIDSALLAADSRSAHQKLFELLTPPSCSYYAGHYRGANYRCLLYLSVGIPSDPRVGSPPHRVRGDMHTVAFEVKAGLAALDTAQKLPN